jgi:hypothetical protein
MQINKDKRMAGYQDRAPFSLTPHYSRFTAFIGTRMNADEALAGCGKAPKLRHSRESGSPELLDFTGFPLSRE